MRNGKSCPNCESSNENDARFCKTCGHGFSEVVAPVAAATRWHTSWKVVVPIALLVLVVGRAAFPAQFSSAMNAAKRVLGLGSRADSSTVATLDGPPTIVPFGDTALTPAPELTIAVPQPPNDFAKASVTEERPAPRAIRPEATAQARPKTGAAIRPGDSPNFERPAPVTAESRPTAPTATTIQPEMPPPAPKLIAAGTTLQLKSLDKVCTDKNKQDELFRTVVDQPVEGANGAAIPKGAVVMFIVDRLSRTDGKVEFSISPLSVELNGTQAPIRASVDAVSLKKANKGLLGAVVGVATGIAAAKAAGGDAKAAVLGGAVGGAAGALIGKQLQNADGCIEANAPIRITLRSDLTPP